MPTPQPQVLEIEQALASETFFANPYPLYHRLRAELPVFWSEKLKCWLLTRYDDCLAALKDNRRLSNRDRMSVLLKPLGDDAGDRFKLVCKHFMQGVIFSDPPDHTRLRNLINKALTPAAIEKKRARIQTIVEGFLDGLQDRGQMELIRDFAFPLPNTIRSEIFGLPLEDSDQLKNWADDVVALFGGGADADRIERGQESLSDLRDYLGRIISARHQNPGDDLISMLIQAREAGDQLSDEELLSTCSTLFTASQETTTAMIGSGILALLRNPGQLQKLKDNPHLIATAVEEMLRYDGPLQRQLRAATENFEIRGMQITEGQMVCPVLGAANRDPEQFARPDEFDITRAHNPHMAFGFGIHGCVGAPLARLEVQVAINTLIRRLTNIRLTTEVIDRTEDYTVRSIKSLPIIFDAAR